MSAFNPAPYPACLTPKYWDKNKGALAKMAVRETGVGASLKELESLYKSTFELVDALNIDKRPSVNNFNLAAWDKLRDAALGKGLKDCQRLRQAAYNTSNLLSNTGAIFAKNKLVSKDSVKLCAEMEKAADKLAEDYNPAKVKKGIEENYHQGRAWLDKVVELVTDGALPKICSEVENLLQKMQHPSDWTKLNTRSETRRVTQILGNAVKVTKAGYPLNVNARECKQLFDDLLLYADKEAQPFGDDDIKGFNQHRRALSKLLAEAAKVR